MVRAMAIDFDEQDGQGLEQPLRCTSRRRLSLVPDDYLGPCRLRRYPFRAAADFRATADIKAIRQAVQWVIPPIQVKVPINLNQSGFLLPRPTSPSCRLPRTRTDAACWRCGCDDGKRSTLTKPLGFQVSIRFRNCRTRGLLAAPKNFSGLVFSATTPPSMKTIRSATSLANRTS